jgi:hypothetical protein
MNNQNSNATEIGSLLETQDTDTQGGSTENTAIATEPKASANDTGNPASKVGASAQDSNQREFSELCDQLDKPWTQRLDLTGHPLFSQVLNSLKADLKTLSSGTARFNTRYPWEALTEKVSGYTDKVRLSKDWTYVPRLDRHSYTGAETEALTDHTKILFVHAYILANLVLIFAEHIAP